MYVYMYIYIWAKHYNYLLLWHKKLTSYLKRKKFYPINFTRNSTIFSTIEHYFDKFELKCIKSKSIDFTSLLKIPCWYTSDSGVSLFSFYQKENQIFDFCKRNIKMKSIINKTNRKFYKKNCWYGIKYITNVLLKRCFIIFFQVFWSIVFCLKISFKIFFRIFFPYNLFNEKIVSRCFHYIF